MLRSEYAVYDAEGLDAKVLPITVFYGSATKFATKSDLALRLETTESNIKSFNKYGDDLYFSLNTPIALRQDAFSYGNGALVVNIRDEGNFTTSQGNVFRFSAVLQEVYFEKMTNVLGSFARASKIKKAIFKSATSFSSSSSFLQCDSIELIDARKVKTIGTSPSIDDTNFVTIKTGCVINVNVFLKTANAGAPDVELTRAKTESMAIINFYDDNGIYHSTL